MGCLLSRAAKFGSREETHEIYAEQHMEVWDV
jgi:hypothetical protein